jgi:hypothetical protein
MNYIIKAILSLLMLTICSVLLSQSGPGAILPTEKELPGWRPSGDLKIFSSESISKLVGGDAGLFREFGIRNAVSRDYYNVLGKVINIQVYTMENTFGSCGIFLQRTKGEKVFREFGNASCEKPGSFIFWKQYYYIIMSSGSSGDSISKGFRLIAGFIDAKIKSKGIFPEILGFSDEKPGNVTIFRGPLALANIYYFSPLNIFKISEGIAIENGETCEIILKYADNNETVRRFSDAAGILGGMSKFTDFVMAGNYSFIMKDKNGKTLTFRVDENCMNILIR